MDLFRRKYSLNYEMHDFVNVIVNVRDEEKRQHLKKSLLAMEVGFITCTGRLHDYGTKLRKT